MRIPITLSLLILSFGPGLGLHAQPTLHRLWARHDQFVLEGDPKPLPSDPSCSFTFKGKHGQVVRGWDVGDPHGPVVLWWQGGPGIEATPESDTDTFVNPKAYRHIEIDQPGTGKSEWIPGWKPEDTVEDAATFLRQRDVTGPVIVCGWSWGSTMALLFAQRHPEWVRGVVVGGIWTNSAAEVRYYMDAAGPRSWAPGLSAAFQAFSNGKGTACDLHKAIREGRGGESLAQAYSKAEIVQCRQGQIPRKPPIEPVADTAGKPVDLATEPNEIIRFAYIESEMMCRGQRGEWALKQRFPKGLAAVPLIVLQGRYDQVCDPEVARRIYRAWPGDRKLFVPLPQGHSQFSGPSNDELNRAGLVLSADQNARLQRANGLHFGSFYLVGAAIDCLVHPEEGH